MKTHDMVPYNVVIAILSEELDRETSHIPDGVSTALLTASGTKTEKHRGFLADAIEELG
jgi:hypothetical protein